MYTRIKICGITRIEDALISAHYGADAIGMVFYGPSPRSVSVDQAAHICAALPPFVSTVGLFVDADAACVREVLESVPLDILQFHGNEIPAFCRQFDRPYLKAFRVKPDLNLLECAAKYHDAAGLLLDAYVKGVPGGTGATFDWALIPDGLNIPIVLSGGLDGANVKRAIETVRPWAVDVSSGVEAAKGIKDPAKIVTFINGVRNAGI